MAIVNGNLELFPDNVSIISQTDIRSGAIIIRKTIIISAMGNKKIFTTL